MVQSSRDHVELRKLCEHLGIVPYGHVTYFAGKIDYRHRRLVGRVYFGRIAWRETNLQGERVRHI